MGSVRGRKPLVVETIKAGREKSSGRVSSKTRKGGLLVEMEPIFGVGDGFGGKRDDVCVCIRAGKKGGARQ